jgi:hypothetical protein
LRIHLLRLPPRGLLLLLLLLFCPFLLLFLLLSQLPLVGSSCPFDHAIRRGVLQQGSTRGTRASGTSKGTVSGPPTTPADHAIPWPSPPSNTDLLLIFYPCTLGAVGVSGRCGRSSFTTSSRADMCRRLWLWRWSRVRIGLSARSRSTIRNPHHVPHLETEPQRGIRKKSARGLIRWHVIEIRGAALHKSIA